MSRSSIGPGTVLGRRYRLDVLLSDHAGARFWRATDTVLARSVAMHTVPRDDPRASRLADAARRSARVSDPHLLRVLDTDTDVLGVTWVVNEWGEGTSLDVLLQGGTLPPDRAAWLTREVAEAVSAAHQQGVPHGRLAPEAVLLSDEGSVKVIGLVVQAALMSSRPPDPVFGDVDAREGDVIDLAGILYAALTGRWPGVSRSDVPRAPTGVDGPLRPRQVRAGIPRTLDMICTRVLSRDASHHSLRIGTALEVAAALSDFVGDPAGAALHLPGSAAEPTQPPQPSADATPELTDALTDVGLTPVDDPEATAPSAAVSGGDTGSGALAPVGRAAGPGSTGSTGSSGSSGVDLLPERSRPAASPPPPFEQPVERPLFADTERRVPAGMAEREAGGGHHPSGVGGAWDHAQGTPERTGQDAAFLGPPEGPGPGHWPFGEPEQDGFTGREGRNWLRLAAIVGVVIALAAAMTVAFTLGRNDSPTDDPGATGSSSSSPSASTTSTGRAVRVAGVRDFDPEGADGGSENPDETGLAVDGDPSTGWHTSTYYNNPALGGLKSGVGLMVDLGSDRLVSSLALQLTGSPTAVSVYAAPSTTGSAPTSLDGLQRVGAQPAAGTRVRFDLGAVNTRYVVVWLTDLPAVSDGYRGEVDEITVRS